MSLGTLRIGHLL